MPAIKAEAQSEIDLSSSIVVKGKEKIPPSGMFSNSFEQYLILNLSQPVDLVDISKKTKFSQIITLEGIQIYG